MPPSKEKKVRQAPDGGTITSCFGCGAWPHSTARDTVCLRCGMLVCRVCAEDQPHRLSADGSKVCPLPEGQAPKKWAVGPRVGPDPFPRPIKESLAEGRARSTGDNA